MRQNKDPQLAHDTTDVTAIMDTNAGDELGTPDSDLVRCACGTLHRVGDETHPEVCDQA